MWRRRVERVPQEAPVSSLDCYSAGWLVIVFNPAGTLQVLEGQPRDPHSSLHRRAHRAGHLTRGSRGGGIGGGRIRRSSSGIIVTVMVLLISSRVAPDVVAAASGVGSSNPGFVTRQPRASRLAVPAHAAASSSTLSIGASAVLIKYRSPPASAGIGFSPSLRRMSFAEYQPFLRCACGRLARCRPTSTRRAGRAPARSCPPHRGQSPRFHTRAARTASRSRCSVSASFSTLPSMRDLC